MLLTLARVTGGNAEQEAALRLWRRLPFEWRPNEELSRAEPTRAVADWGGRTTEERPLADLVIMGGPRRAHQAGGYGGSVSHDPPSPPQNTP